MSVRMEAPPREVALEVQGKQERHSRNGGTGSKQLPRFLAGDIALFAGQGDLYSKASRWLMRGDGEGPTYAVHTAQFLDAHRVLEMDCVGRIRPSRSCSIDDTRPIFGIGEGLRYGACGR